MTLWMISNRRVGRWGLSGELSPRLTYWRTSEGADATAFESWTRMTPAAFKGGLIEAAAALPPPEPDGSHEAQKHVTLLIHGYNSSWGGAATWYQKIVDSIFRADDGLGIPVLFTWPSKGSPAEYLADRREAEDAAGGLAEVLSELYDWLVGVQARSLEDPTLACRAKTSIIAHSMGNYVLQKAAAVAWARKNKPLLVSLVNQLVMVAADVDNDLFKSGEMVDQSDGDALANLTYRITALYSGLDQVLGVSAGLKHFGKRRLGRSGLDTSDGPPDNVWDFDCTSLFQVDHVGGFNAHGAYFDEPSTMNLMRLILSGLDREMIRRQVRVAEAGAR